MELVLPMYNARPDFSLKNLGKKSAHYTQQNTILTVGELPCGHPSSMFLKVIL